MIQTDGKSELLTWAQSLQYYTLNSSFELSAHCSQCYHFAFPPKGSWEEQPSHRAWNPVHSTNVLPLSQATAFKETEAQLGFPPQCIFRDALFSTAFKNCVFANKVRYKGSFQRAGPVFGSKLGHGLHRSIWHDRFDGAPSASPPYHPTEYHEDWMSADV